MKFLSEGLTRPRLKQILRWLALVTLGTVFLVARKINALSHPFIWAEDGSVFLQDAMSGGWSIANIYAGQLWVIQRLLMYPVSLLPTSFIPQAIFITSAIVTSALAGVVLQRRMKFLFGRFRFQVLAFGLLMALPGLFEGLNGILSIYLWLPITASLVVAAPSPVTRIGRWSESIFLLLAGLTSLTALVILPVAIWAIVARKTGRDFTNFSLISLLSLLEVLILWQSPRSPGSSANVTDYVLLLIKKSGGVLVLGDANLGTLWTSDSRVLLGLVSFSVLVLAAILALLAPASPRLAVLFSSFFYASLGIFAAANPSALYPQVAGGRYFIPLISAVVMVSVMALGSTNSIQRTLGTVLISLCLFGFVSDIRLYEVAPVGIPELKVFEICLSKNLYPCQLDIAPGPPWEIIVK